MAMPDGFFARRVPRNNGDGKIDFSQAFAFFWDHLLE
jgi:hypothetical protein